MGLARELAERIAAMQYSDLSEEAIYWGKIALLDTVGVTLAGCARRRAAHARRGGRTRRRRPEPDLRQRPARRAPLDAALVNGTAAHALDFDNTASNIGGHVSAVMVPALIAAARRTRSSGRTSCSRTPPASRRARIGRSRSIRCIPRRAGIRPSTLGVFAVTAACARLLGLTVDQTETALALARRSRPAPRRISAR